MPFGPSGNYVLPDGYQGVDGQPILVSQHNPPLEDIQSALNLTLLRDGRAPMTAPLNMNTFKLLNLANGTNLTDAVNLSQLNGSITSPAANSIIFNGVDYMIQFGRSSVSTNGIGDGFIAFPTVFTTSTPTVLAQNFSTSSTYFNVYDTTAGGFNFRTFNPAVVAGLVGCFWIAIGAKT